MKIRNTFRDYINENFAEDFSQPISFEESRNSVVRVYVFYDTFSYIKSTEKETSGSILDLASNIGGILGLFLGVSVLSLFELIEVIIEYFLLSNKST